MEAIKVNNLCVDYGARRILDGFDVSVAAGEAVLLRGRSGCGKSTLLRAMCGLLEGEPGTAHSGEVLVFGQPVQKMERAERAKEIGIVFQNPDTQLFLGTVEDEIAFGLENLRVPQNEMARRVDEALELTGMSALRSASPSGLSGGQKQLVVLMCVMAMNPRILLLDEAMSQVDAWGRERILGRLQAMKRDGKTIVIVEHRAELSGLIDRAVDVGTVTQ